MRSGTDLFASALALMALGLGSCSPSSSRQEAIGIKPAALSVEKSAFARQKLQVDHTSWRSKVTRGASLKPVADSDWTPLESKAPDFDAIHYLISLNFPPASLTQPQFDGEVELTFRPNQPSYQVLSLDSIGLEITKVSLRNTLEDLLFQSRDGLLQIDLGKAYSPVDTLTVAISYRWVGAKGVSFRSRTGVPSVEAIYSQSEPESSKYWFPGNSHPNDRATFESYIRVPKPFVAVSNGALVSVYEEDASRVYHWSQRIPMVSYLFVVTAGKFGLQQDWSKTTPIQYFGPADDMDRLGYSLRDTPKMVEFFSQKTGFRYPFEKYAQVVVPQYPYGGMEHTTATTLTDLTVHAPADDLDFSSDGLVAHELAHQWFGDLLTCRSWDHLWLNEGFASFFGALYHEHSQGTSEYLHVLDQSSDWYFMQEAEVPRPVVFPYFQSGLDEFFDGHTYMKGAWILHMLRARMGEEAFFKGIRHYLFKHQNTLVTTEDFRSALEESSGLDLSSFFDQWLYRPGYPHFGVNWSYQPADKKVLIEVAQLQDLGFPGGLAGTQPVYTGPIEVEVDSVHHTLEILSGSQRFDVPAAKEPRYVNFNSKLKWLAKVKVNQDEKAWEAQLRWSLDVTARVSAARELSHTKTLATAGALADCARRDPESWVRSECVSALGLLSEVEDQVIKDSVRERLLGLSNQMDSSWEVRKSLATALGTIQTAPGYQALQRLAKRETTVSVIAAALQAIGRVRVPESFDFLVSQLGIRSHNDMVQWGVLKGLQELVDLRGFAIGEEYTRSVHGEDLRAAALGLLAKLGFTFPTELAERARLVLESVLRDPSAYLRYSAITGLGDLKNKNAIPALEQLASSDPELFIRELAKKTAKSLAGAGTNPK